MSAPTPAANPSWSKAATLEEALQTAGDFISCAKTLDRCLKNLARGERVIYTIEVYTDNYNAEAHLRLVVNSSTSVLVRKHLSWDTPATAARPVAQPASGTHS